MRNTTATEQEVVERFGELDRLLGLAASSVRPDGLVGACRGGDRQIVLISITKRATGLADPDRRPGRRRLGVAGPWCEERRGGPGQPVRHLPVQGQGDVGCVEAGEEATEDRRRAGGR